ncbi:hypothetical protein ACFCZ3_14760 [Cellulosimicrobium cellulans]|uniref:hypothetical protein n=1 Tax=Cellulosimicrobium cellulans TaxID=1710 RepID=UPI0035D9C346
MIDPHAGPIGTDGSVFGNSDEVVCELEKSGQLGSVVPRAEPTIDSEWHRRRFELHHRAQRIARAARRDDDENRQREAMRLYVLSKMPTWGVSARSMAHDLQCTEAEARAFIADQIGAGWLAPTGSLNTLDGLGPATVDILLT